MTGVLSLRACALAALATATTVAFAPTASRAGGFDLTNQPIDIIFEEGNYVEIGAGYVTADVEGTNPLGDAGNVAEDLFFGTFGAKVDFTDSISGALIYDTPFLRETAYDKGLFEGTAAEVEANTFTLVGRYKFNDNISVFAGPRAQKASIDLQGPFARLPTGQVTSLPTYQIDVNDWDVGFVAGAAYEIPDIKVRAAVTYNSEITHDFDANEVFASPFGPVVQESEFDVDTPQSVNLSLQAPISTSTLVKADIRWADWGGIDFAPPAFQASQGRPVVEYTEDVFTYRLTVAQRLNPNLAVFVTGSYEDDGGEEISLFKTVDGGYSLGGGIVFESDEGFVMRLGGEYRWLEGTAGPQLPGAPASRFDEAEAVAVSLKLGYRF